MTDRIKGFWVALDQDIREDDVEEIVNAVRCVRHVAAVEVSVTDPQDWMARQRVRSEVAKGLYDAMTRVLSQQEGS